MILAFDTSVASCAVALVHGDRVLARRIEGMERGQAERLLPMLQEALLDGGATWRDLAAIAVCTGPGNFTGLRIAVAAARGIALGRSIPAVGVTRLEALADGRTGPCLVAVDAGRGALVAQTFRDGSPVGPPALVEPNTLLGRDVSATRLGAAAEIGFTDANQSPDPAAVARVANRRLTEPPVAPRPFYVRASDAARPAEPPPLILDDT